MTRSSAYGAVYATLAKLMLQGIVSPEPFGTANLVGDGRAEENLRQFTSERDTLTPLWSGRPTWSHVLLSPNVRLHVELMDYDVLKNDPIGAFELNERDFEDALASGDVYQVQVADQTYNQVLFAGITVRESVDPGVAASSR